MMKCQKEEDIIENEINYYELLEIKENASPEVIKAAYKALAKKYHPDSFEGNSLEREKSMIQINEAYTVLSDEKKRKEYDLKMKMQKKFTDSYQSQQDTDGYNQETDRDNMEYASPGSHKGDTETNYREPIKEDYNDDRYHNSNGGLFGKIIGGIGREIISNMQHNSREVENAYLQGLSMDDYLLVRRFKQATGYRRVGYSKALEEKGLLERDNGGKLVPTYRFKQLF